MYESEKNTSERAVFEMAQARIISSGLRGSGGKRGGRALGTIQNVLVLLQRHHEQ